MKRWVNSYLPLLISIVGPLACVMVVFAFFACDRSFDSQVWKNSTGGNSGARQRMLRDLQEKHQLVGMKKAEVLRLLGPPDRPSFSPGLPDCMVYQVDHHGLRWLRLRFEDDAVSTATVWLD